MNSMGLEGYLSAAEAFDGASAAPAAAMPTPIVKARAQFFICRLLQPNAGPIRGAAPRRPAESGLPQGVPVSLSARTPQTAMDAEPFRMPKASTLCAISGTWRDDVNASMRNLMIEKICCALDARIRAKFGMGHCQLSFGAYFAAREYELFAGSTAYSASACAKTLTTQM
jgi:hypothetical protein